MKLCTCFKGKKIAAFFISGIFLQTVSGQFAPADSVFTAGLPNNNFIKLQKDGGFVIRGTYDAAANAGDPAAEGPGTRLLWYPQRAAFRVGHVAGINWDSTALGDYSFAAGYNTTASGDYSTALGFNSQALQQQSFAAGDQCTASGAASVAMGYHAHTNARQGSFVFADRSNVDTLRAGVNHSSNWRVSGGFRIFTSSSLATGVTLQSGVSVSNWGQSSAVISTSTGAMLTTGGVWQNASDINKKHLFKDISAEEILQKLNNIPIREWGYKTESAEVRHIGPVAQDFFHAFSLGTDEKSIGTVDADGVALACIQALSKRTEDQAKELEALKKSNAALTERMEKLEEQKSTSNRMNLSMLPLAFLPVAGIGMWFFRKRKEKKEENT